MQFLHNFWIHITGAISLILGWLFKDKIGDIVKSLFNWLFKDHSAALQKHEEDDKQRFEDIKSQISQSEERIIRANDSTKTDIMMAVNRLSESTDRRLILMEKVFLDSRLNNDR